LVVVASQKAEGRDSNETPGTNFTLFSEGYILVIHIYIYIYIYIYMYIYVYI